jgi:hypothetical protein
MSKIEIKKALGLRKKLCTFFFSTTSDIELMNPYRVFYLNRTPGFVTLFKRS